ncbi:MAG: DUF58 domain-containing protein [Defluviitaleaceae bacterium]|nr:DUF58 domain-containing protein [Defluviitaleaceae bacterium]
MTKRMVYLAGLGLVFIGIAALLSPSLTFLTFIAYNGVILALYIIDYFLTPDSKVFTLTRQEDEKLYFKTTNIIEFKVKNSWSRKLKIEIKDELPDFHFKVSDENMEGEIPYGEERVFSYTVTPTKRGAYIFPAVYIRYDGILGLCRKYFSVDESKEFKVYPNLKDLSKYRLIITKHRLMASGQKRVPKRGMGFEFESLRDYVSGDDYRKINWAATARSNKFMVNQYEAEKNQPVYTLLDTGRAMSYSIRGYKKLDYAINATLILSDIVGQKGDNSGLMVFNTDVSVFIKPGKGDIHRNELMETLYHISDSNLSSDYAGAFLHLLKVQKRRSIVFIFTDFETGEEAKELMETIPILCRAHVPVVVLCVNESLEKIAGERGEGLRDTFNQAMAESLLEERKSLVRALNMRGVICLETYAENFAIDTLNQYLALKERLS